MTLSQHCPACHDGPSGEHGHAAMRAIGHAATFTCVSCLSPWRRTRAFDERYSWEKLGFDPTLFDDSVVSVPATVARTGFSAPTLGAMLKRLVRRPVRAAHA